MGTTKNGGRKEYQMRPETKKELLQWIAAVVLVITGAVVLMYGPSLPMAKAQEGSSDPGAGVDCACPCGC
jgi:hypothetical protein